MHWMKSSWQMMLALGLASILPFTACGRTSVVFPSSGEDAPGASGAGIGEGDARGSGGAIATGGAVGSGGTGAGGATGTGGISATGGAPGSGGVFGSGGIASAGTTGRGGTTASAGTTGRGGTVGTGGLKGQGGSVGAGGGGGWRTGTVVAPRPPAEHRPQAPSCVGVNSPPEPYFPTTMTFGSCTKHADCTQGKNGKCVHGRGSASNYYYCVYDQCGSDADCDIGKVCYCGPTTAARCLSVGNCRTDADCLGGSGGYGYCSPSMGMDCGGYHSIDSYHCHTPEDTCIDDTDCTGRDYCNFDDYDGRWKCEAPNMMCVIG